METAEESGRTEWDREGSEGHIKHVAYRKREAPDVIICMSHKNL